MSEVIRPLEINFSDYQKGIDEYFNHIGQKQNLEHYVKLQKFFELFFKKDLKFRSYIMARQNTHLTFKFSTKSYSEYKKLIVQFEDIVPEKYIIEIKYQPNTNLTVLQVGSGVLDEHIK